jgi:hypothetical protein
MNTPDAVAVDGSGNVWIANEINPGSVTALTSMGVAISPSTGYRGAVSTIRLASPLINPGTSGRPTF